MYATKEAYITKETNPDIDTYIFYMDLRAYGKEFQEYYCKAQDLGVNYIRGRPGTVYENPDGSLIVKVKDTEGGKIKEITLDMLILCSAIEPDPGAVELAGILGIEQDEYGFFKSRDPLGDPILSSKDGIFLAGCAQGPKDIPDSVAMGSGASARAMAFVPERTVEEKEVPAEKDIAGQEPRVGVFVCHCGKNIAGYLDVEEVTEYAKSLENVVFADHDMFVCSDDVQVKIRNAIKEHDLNRIVVASCSPKTHADIFQETMEQAGLNRYLFDMANIRNHCSWVHSDNREKATAKAKDLVRIAVAKVRLLEPLQRPYITIGKTGLVLGGGYAGMMSALGLADQGFKTYLVEREPELGGMLRKIDRLYPLDVPAKDVLDPVIRKVSEHDNIQVMTGSELVDIDGNIGNFEATVKNGNREEKVKIGAIIVATGSEPKVPEGLYEYGNHPSILTQLELEERFIAGTLEKPRNVVFINCVGAMENDMPHCCRVGCGISLKNAKRIKEMFPESRIFMLYRDMRVFGKREEEYYSELLEKFKMVPVRYTPDSKPEVDVNNGKINVRVKDALMREDIEIPADLVVLTPTITGSRGVEDLAKILKLPINKAGFFVEAHAKIRPLDFSSDGIFMSGAAHFPKGLADVAAQALGAASRASTVLSQDRIEMDAQKSYVVDKNCDGCAFCVEPCPYNAITLVEYKSGDTIKKTIQIDETACKGCGVCMATCPKEGVYVRGFSLQQLKAMVEAALEVS
jgi:heterodisulfide reductase subunit A